MDALPAPPLRIYTVPVKKLLRVGIFLFGALSIGAFSYSSFLVWDLVSQRADNSVAKPKYHFALYLPDNRDSFFEAIIQGAEKAATEAAAAISIHSIETSRNELELASYTGVDGVIVCPYLDDKTAKRQLDRLTDKKIPVVIINHYVPSDLPWPYIGTNHFEVGTKMGTFVSRLTGQNAELALVYSEKAPGIFAEKELVEMGITQALQGKDRVSIKAFKTNLNPFDAEAIMYGLLRASPQINTVIFTDSNDTIAAAQVLIDMNLVGRVQIIGFGDEPSIVEFIRKGIVAGSVAMNPEKIGYEAVRSLTSLTATGYTPASIDSGVAIIEAAGL